MNSRIKEGPPIQLSGPSNFLIGKKQGKDMNKKEFFNKPENYIRVGTDYYLKGYIITSKEEKVPALKPWNISTIRSDFDSNKLHEIKDIPKYLSFINVPDNSDKYRPVIEQCYNLYEKLFFFPGTGKFLKTESFLKHLFGNHIELIYDWLTILYRFPTQKLPLICLVSKENETGKTTFLFWLCKIFGNNAIRFGNQDFQNRFNTHWASKLLICIDETFIEKRIIKEVIKRLTTDDTIQMEAKGRDQVKLDFIGKFIMTSNNETNFIEMDNEDNRFFVVKAPVINKKEPDLLENLIQEIPAFLHFLNTRKIFHPQTRRLWFDPVLYATEALKKVVTNSRSKVEKQMILHFTDLFCYDEIGAEIKVTPVLLAKDLEGSIKNLSGLQSEIEKVFKENWNMVPEKNQRFNYPTIEKTGSEIESGTNKAIMQYEINLVASNGKPYSITRTFIDSLTGEN